MSLISLQKGYGSEQLAEFQQHYTVHELGDNVDEDAGAFMDTAAVMKNLDLVITSDTAVAHLAGALAVPSDDLDEPRRGASVRVGAYCHHGVLRG